MDLASASLESFQPLIDQAFSVNADEQAPLVLIKVESKSRALESGRTPFALLFRAQSIEIMPQCTYRLEHDSLGSIDLFLVPVEQGDSHVLYEAVFN
jgi:hypothetical protein